MKTMIILALLIVSAFAKCFYVPCNPETSSGKSQVTSNIDSVDSSIKEKIKQLQEKQNEEDEQLDILLSKQEEMMKDTSQKEVYLQKINHLSQILTNLIKAQEQ